MARKQVIVEMRGGVLVEAYSKNAEIELIVVDWDDKVTSSRKDAVAKKRNST